MRDYPLEEILLPMNAKEVKDEAKMEALWDDPNYVAEEKYDGSRYLSIGGRFFSRRISDVDGLPVEKTANVPHLHFLQNYPNLILDGEIYFEGLTSNEVTKIMGAKPEKAIARQEEGGYLNYVAFDILRDMDGNWLMDLPWKERRAKLREALAKLSSNPYIRISHVEETHKRTFYNWIMENGGEGVILKNIHAKYIPDKRPAWNWVKVKKHITDDVVIIGFKDPVKEYTGKELDTWQYWIDCEYEQFETFNGKAEVDEYVAKTGAVIAPVTKFYFNGWIGAVKFGKYDKDGNLVELGECSGLTDELRKDMSENPSKYIGEVMEIGAMEKTKDGYYRHPQFSRLRPDKSARDCVIGS